MDFYFFERQEAEGVPAGLTVSKKPELPEGDFRIDEYTWPGCTLWFVEEDKFTDDERQAVVMNILWKGK